MVIRTTTRLAIGVITAHLLFVALDSALWWALDSGPWSGDPVLVLNDDAAAPAVRVYGDHPDLDARSAARRTADSLDDAGGFDRSVLLVTIPTGSGWVDPEQVAAVEDWAGGDVATVAMRYSAAPSAAVFALRPELATESAHAILAELTGRIRMLPPQDRPQLVVHGLSLGARAGSKAMADPALADVVDASIWQGPPGADADAERTDETGPAPESDRKNASNPCTVTVVNPDDPVAELTWDLLRDPIRALGVLSALPGSDSATPGEGHRYQPVVPPAGCVSPGI